MNIVITAGGTEEKIDEVRKITNMSSGKLGAVIAEEFLRVWDKYDWDNLLNPNHLFYICNKNSIKPDVPAHMKSYLTIIETTDVDSVEWSIGAVLGKNKIDYFIHSMAISDYKFAEAYYDRGSAHDIDLVEIDTSSKMKSNNDEIYLRLIKTPKIIDRIKTESPGTSLISFKLMNDVSKEKLIETGRKQLQRTNSDVVICNDLKVIKQGTHQAFAVSKDSVVELKDKWNIANFIVRFTE